MLGGDSDEVIAAEGAPPTPATPASPTSIAEGSENGRSPGGSSAAAGAGAGADAFSSVGRTPGTPAYTAPECTAGGAFSGVAADVWCARGAAPFVPVPIALSVRHPHPFCAVLC
jgi:hypothetical protein